MKKWIITACSVLIIAICIGCASSSINVITYEATKDEVSTEEVTQATETTEVASTAANNKQNNKTLNVRIDGSTDNDSGFKKNLNNKNSNHKNTEPTEKPPQQDPTSATVYSRELNQATIANPTVPPTTVQPTTQQPTEPVETQPSTSAQTNSVRRVTWHARVIRPVKVVDQAAYTYVQPIYVYEVRQVCNRCGCDITNNLNYHMMWEQQQFGYGCGYTNQQCRVQKGQETVRVPEKYHYEDRVVREAGYY